YHSIFAVLFYLNISKMKYTLIKPSLSGLRRKACHMEVTLHQKGIKVILGYIFLNITIVNI
ncbi:MAG: hypothetical protein AAGJ58_07735, partial [Pseudomonadota bacterium]